jgi:hypothetical protein
VQNFTFWKCIHPNGRSWRHLQEVFSGHLWEQFVAARHRPHYYNPPLSISPEE